MIWLVSALAIWFGGSAWYWCARALRAEQAAEIWQEECRKAIEARVAAERVRVPVQASTAGQWGAFH